ncbi:glutathione S-transferase family protein [Pinirhizobacter soli]|uniref:glutathione S-transferase family protein n=1 Tax=Pinirhizobacter soli TaxID=2786953 RepID=UPI002029C85F|nr:glutathione S-transferase family protein [Pinirhizobacter soli]
MSQRESLNRAASAKDGEAITVFGEGRGFRVVWLLEEMGLPYQLRPVDLLAGVEDDAEFLAINPAGFIPAMRDGDVTMVESIAIMEYLMARYGPTPLAPGPHDPAFPAYQQFLHLGEAGLAASIYFVVGARNFAPASERQNWSAGQALEVFESRLMLVTQQLARTPYLAGETFTAADISVAYALGLARRSGGITLGEAEQSYMARMSAREGCQRAMNACHATRAWLAQAPIQ